MKDLIKIGIPSKGRLRKDVLNIFKKNKLKLISKRGDRDLFGSVKGKKNINLFFLKIFKTSFLSLPLLGIPILIKSFIKL